MRGQTAQGAYAASEWSWFAGPTKAWAKDGTLRGLRHWHGHGGGALDCRDSANADLLTLTNLLATTYPTLSFDAGGAAHWGYTAAVARGGDGATYLQTTWGTKSGGLIEHGDSMGALGALNRALANPSEVRAIALTRPVLDPHDIVTNNRGGFAAEVNTTYGGAYSEATHGPTYNPCNYGAALNGIPIWIWNASDDAIAVQAAVDAFLGLCASASATSVGAVGHSGVLAAMDKTAFMSFLAAHA